MCKSEIHSKILSKYAGFSKSIVSKDDNYCTVLILKWVEKTTSTATIHTHECVGLPIKAFSVDIHGDTYQFFIIKNTITVSIIDT